MNAIKTFVPFALCAFRLLAQDELTRRADITKGGELVFGTTAHATFPLPPDAAHSCSNRMFCGVSSVAVSPSGKRLWATYYASPTGWEDSNNYIVLATSDDRGTTWRDVLVYDHPDGDQGPDGTIYLTWDGLRTKRGDVHLARFTEDEVLDGCLKGDSRRDIIITEFLKHNPAD